MSQIVELQKSLQMIPNSNQFPGNLFSENQFSTSAWALGWLDMMRQTFHMDQKMRNKIPHLLVPILWTSFDAEKSNIRKIVRKTILRRLKLRGLSSNRWKHNLRHFWAYRPTCTIVSDWERNVSVIYV